ncbi:MAG: hypothetical protein A2Z14_04840 [Chloroflexi bacterium RBG_16_48_8]|nr:MAG: hypothetical protein A2Z14_04840 [Chloroflexi bacterium RBG_16_48_8]
MSMQALNQLVARSIIDPAIVQKFSSGIIAEVLSDLDFTHDLREKLVNLTADTWVEFAILAYRLVKSTEPVTATIDLPSPAEGLFIEETHVGKEQVA